MDSPLKEETPNTELPYDENKLFNEEDDVGTSTICDLSAPSEEEEEAMFGNMPLISYSNALHFIMMVKSQKGCQTSKYG